jgi:hypothetical protein
VSYAPGSQLFGNGTLSYQSHFHFSGCRGLLSRVCSILTHSTHVEPTVRQYLILYSYLQNVVWVRGDLRRLYRVRDARNGVLHYPKGSVLYLKRVTPHDVGLYRCMATSRNPRTGNTQTVFQDVDFYPRV